MNLRNKKKKKGNRERDRDNRFFSFFGLQKNGRISRQVVNDLNRSNTYKNYVLWDFPTKAHINRD